MSKEEWINLKERSVQTVKEETEDNYRIRR